MFPPQSERSKELCRRVAEFMEAHVYPNEGLYKRQVDEAKDRWDVPPVMKPRPILVEPAIMNPAVYIPYSPRSQLWAMWQILSSFAPERMKVDVSVARSMAQLLPISTSSPITTFPSWHILRGLPCGLRA